MFFSLKKHLTRRFFFLVFSVALLAAVTYLFHFRQVRFTYINSSSMEPTILPGDHFVTWNPGQFSRGDVVTFLSPRDGEMTTKRLVAMGGDTVSIARGRLRLNGEEAREPYLMEPLTLYSISPLEIPDGYYFLLGDNRNRSEDSSVWGPVPGENLRGRIILRYRPWRRRGRI